MSSPLYDALSVQHSRNIRDTVAAAATNGVAVSSAQRDNHFNNACRIWMKKKAIAKDWNALRPLLASVSSTLSSSAIALASVTGGVFFIRSLVVTNTSLYEAKPMHPMLSAQITMTNSNQFLAPSATEPKYIIEGTTLTVHPTATYVSNAYTLKYVKQHAALSANSASEVLVIEKDYWDEILALALIEFEKEKADPQSLERIKLQSDNAVMQGVVNF